MGPAPAHELPPPLELECLKALWTLGEGSVRQVQDAIASERQLAYTTVMTVMDRLARRGCVRRKKNGRSFVYAPVLTQSAVRTLAVQDLVDCLFGGSEESLRQFLSDRPFSFSDQARTGTNQ
jgi:BlaI family transcriptional regulator, penicillinase repressor